MTSDPPKHVIAVYPGTFDPITNGHLDILSRALNLFDHIVVTLAVNPRKQPLFTVEERIGFIRDAMPEHVARLSFASFSGLLVEFCREQQASVIVRGLRALADFEYEFQFSHMNRRLAPEIESVFFMTDERNHYVSSSLVKEVASLGGDVTGLVPPAVVSALAKKYGR
jgi:pantetheine-phosphate adenylyltransferase